MPSKEQILKVLANEAGRLHRNKIAEKLGENTYRSFQTQLDRFEKQGLIDGNPDHEYEITDVGIKELADQSMVTEETDEEKLGTTEYQRFIHLGKITGISPPELIKQTADHVWNGGDFSDLDWVAQALQEMGIRQDMRNRWWHSWRTSLNKPMPSQMPSAIMEKTEESRSDKKEGKSGRSFILDPDDKPVYVGEGLGDMFYADALDLAKIRSGRGRAGVVATQSPGSMAEEVTKMFTAFQTMMGDNARGKSYFVRQGEEGLQVEEVDPGQPMILNYPQGNNKNATYFVNQEGEVQEVQPGVPIVIKQAPPPSNNTGTQYLIDKATGQITQVQPGQPIVIQATPPQQQNPYIPIQVDEQGNPRVPPDFSTWLRLEEWKVDQQRKQEKHDAQMDIIQGVKDLASKATAAFSRMAEKK